MASFSIQGSEAFLCLYASFATFALDNGLDTLDRNGESRWTHLTMADLQQFIFLSVRVCAYLCISFQGAGDDETHRAFRVAPKITPMALYFSFSVWKVSFTFNLNLKKE